MKRAFVNQSQGRHRKKGRVVFRGRILVFVIVSAF